MILQWSKQPPCYTVYDMFVPASVPPSSLCTLVHPALSCACEACNANWGTYPELKAPLRLRCPNCRAPVTEPIGGGTSSVSSFSQKSDASIVPSVKCRECGKPMPFEQMTADLVQAKKRECQRLRGLYEQPSRAINKSDRLLN